MGWGDFATSLADTLVEDTVNEQFHTMTPGDIANTARMVEAENNPSGVDQEAGYDALRSSLDETIAKLVATKEQVNFAEATGDTMLLKQASADLSSALSNSTGYWEAQTEGDGPVEVPWERTITYPEQGFCMQDLLALAVLLLGLVFITQGEKLHKYLICAMGMIIGSFAGLFLCEQMEIVEPKPKWSVALALGVALWIAVMFVEAVLFSALAMAIGGGVCMIGYSVVIQYLPYAVPDYYMFVTIGVGVIVGYFCTSMVKAAALKIIYSVKGGFLCGSAVSYIFWKERMSQGDFWLENLVSNGVGLDPTRWTTWTCIGVMVVCALAGIHIQNSSPKKADKKADNKKDEEAGYGSTKK